MTFFLIVNVCPWELAPQALKREIAATQQELKDLEDFNSCGRVLLGVTRCCCCSSVLVGHSDDEVEDTREAALKKAKRAFNHSAKKGVAELIECGAIDGSPASIANFLFHEDGLKKTPIGEYLGEGEPHNLEVLRAFSILHDFTKMNFDKALR